MHILCPHCRNPIEVVKLTPREEVSCPSCGSSFHLEAGSTTSPERAAGQTLGRFQLLDAVGHGAFGTVYKAHDPELDRTVAVKVPRAGNLAGPQDLDRFLREARSVAQLRHPSIVTVHEVGEADGLPYLVSDFVQGVTLADRLSARRPGFREAAELVAQVADALHFAHGRGVVHRDVKPSNVMIGDDGRACVMDFGLAKRDAGEITMTLEGQVLGTPAYMSPEQARGDAHTVDGRSDVYSLGVILYQLLTGEMPFRGTKQMLLHQVLHDDPRPPRGLNDKIPRDLETICLKAMHKEPGRRYQTARDLADDLRRWLNGEPIKARPVGRLERAGRWARRHPAAAALVAVSGLAVAAVAGLAVGLVFNAELSTAYQSEAAARTEAEAARLAEEEQRKKVEEALGVAEEAKKGEEVQRKKAEDALALADRTAYVHSLFLANAALQQNNVPHALERLKEGKADLRGWEWHYLNGQCQAEPLSFPGHVGAFSPDGARIAVTGTDGMVRVYDAWTGQEALALRGLVRFPVSGFNGGTLRRPIFSPNGTRIAGPGNNGVLRVYDASTGEELIALEGTTRDDDPVFSPDGKRIAVAPGVRQKDGAVRVYELQTGEESLVLKGPAAFGPATFSPDGTRIAVAPAVSQGDGVVRVYDTRTGEESFTLKGATPLHAPSFSPDGTRIAASGDDRVVRVFDALTGRETLVLKGRGRLSFAGFSPDGLRIVAEPFGAEGDGVLRVYDARTGRETLSLKGPAELSSPVFSPDGTQIAASGTDRVVRVFDALTGREVLALKGLGGLLTPRFSPDGTRIATSSNHPDKGDRLVRIYDARHGQEALVLKGPAPFASATFSPDGTRIATRSSLLFTPRREARSKGAVRVYDARTGREVVSLEGSSFSGASAFSPDGKRLAVAEGGMVRVYDVRTWEEILAFEAPTPVGDPPAYSPDAKRLAVAGRVYDAETGREFLTLKTPDRLSTPAYSPDGTRIAAGNHISLTEMVVRVFDAQTGVETLVLTGPGMSGKAVFSPDGTRIAVAPTISQGVVRVYDARTGKEAFTLNGMSGTPAYSPDGTRLAVTDRGMVRVYEAWTGRELFALDVPRGPQRTLDRPELSFSPDGMRLAVVSDGVLRIYDAPTDVPAWQAQRGQALAAGVLDWHREQAAEGERARQGFAAAFHLSRLIQAEPEDGALYLRRGLLRAGMGEAARAKEDFEKALAVKNLSDVDQGTAHAELGQWDEAAKLYARAVEAPDAAPAVWLRHALLRLHLGDREGSAAACATMIKRFGTVSPRYIPTRDAVPQTVALACALAPGALADLKPAVELARAAAKALPSDASTWDALGAILYRAGQYEEAVKELNQAIQLDDGGGKAFEFLFLAMAHHKLGQADEAKKWFDRAVQSLEKDPGPTWNQRLVRQLLRREAEQALKEGPPKSP